MYKAMHAGQMGTWLFSIVTCRTENIMQFLLYISSFGIPLVIFYIVAHGMINRVPIFDTFMDGAKDGLKVVVGIVPTLIGLMVAIGVLRASGALEMLSDALKPVVSGTGFPTELLPLTIIKMLSSSAATSLLLDTFKEFGTDSRLGIMASLMMASTETIFYTMSVYFSAAKPEGDSRGVKSTRWTLPGALLATLAGTIASVIIGAGLTG